MFFYFISNQFFLIPFYNKQLKIKFHMVNILIMFKFGIHEILN